MITDKNIRNEQDRAGLPKWAQRQIEGLLRQNADLIKAQTSGPEDSDTFAEPYLDDWRKPLGKGTTVRFGGAEYDGTFDVRFRNGELTVQANSTDEFVIKPQATNTVRLAYAKR